MMSEQENVEVPATPAPLSVKVEAPVKGKRGPKRKELTDEDKKKLAEIAEKRKKNISEGVSKPRFTERDYEEIAKRIIEKKILEEIEEPKVGKGAPEPLVSLPEKPKSKPGPPKKIIPEPVYKEPELDSDEELNELLANMAPPSRYGNKSDPGFTLPPRFASTRQDPTPQSSPATAQAPPSRYGKKR